MTDSDLFGEPYLRSMFDAFPSPVLIVDRNLIIHDANSAAKRFFGDDISINLKPLCGDILNCIHATASAGGCGTTEFCPECVIRLTTDTVSNGKHSFRQIANMNLKRDGKSNQISLLVSGSPMKFADEEYIIITLEDITGLTELKKVMSICSHCHNIRDDADRWHRIEKYLGKFFNVQFSHGICPDCCKKHYPDLF